MENIEKINGINLYVEGALPQEFSSKVRKIITRADKLGCWIGYKSDRWLDIEATHLNGMPLDFDKWLAFDDFSFKHDWHGITKNIDRTTGKLKRCFVPRCHKVVKKEAA